MTLVKRADLSPDVTDASDVTEQARTLVAVHVGREGMCEGCLSMWARLAPHPCQWAQWARAWLADPAHGGSAQP